MMKKLETKLETKNFMSKNRFYKASMSETLGNRYNSPTKNIVNLYSRWSNGGSGILMTGNVMVDRNALGEPGNIVIEDERDITLLKNWAKVGTQNNNHLWMQINHPGKQSPKNLSKEPVAPSSIPVGGNLSNVFNHPRALKHDEILGIIKRFGNTAYIAKKQALQVYKFMPHMVILLINFYHLITTNEMMHGEVALKIVCVF